MSNTIIINGERIEVQGNNILIKKDGTVMVDGELVKEVASSDVRVSFEGDLANLTTWGSATVTGDVYGDVKAEGSVKCNDVQGDVDAEGSVTCEMVFGKLFALGSVRKRY